MSLRKTYDPGLLSQWTEIQQDQATRAIFDDGHDDFQIDFTSTSGTGHDAFATQAHDYDDPIVSHLNPDSINIQGVTRVGGVDIGYDPLDPDVAIVVLVILSFPSLELLHTFKKEIRPNQPYIPSFLSMRELEHVQAIYDQVITQIPEKDVPGVILVDGFGRWHIRQAGLATAFGMTRGIVTIGIGKEYQPLENDRSRTSGSDHPGPLHFRATQKGFKQVARTKLLKRGEFLGTPFQRDGPIVGATVYTAPEVKSKSAAKPSPAYISPGHKISLGASVALTLKCCIRPGVRLPEPICLADRIGRDELARRKVKL